MKFSANLGFLWTDRPLTDAIRAAKAAGFDAVEMHWPYDIPSADVLAVLKETKLPVLGLNTVRGNPDAGDNGLAALPGRESEARAAIDQAVTYGAAIGAANVHVMAGFASGNDARQTYIANLTYACEKAAAHNMTILIEPLNRHDAPGYFLSNTNQASEIMAELNKSNLKLMYDCYHVGRTEGDVITRFNDLRDKIGHIQFASVPDRGAPDHGELNFDFIFNAFDNAGWEIPLGAEYKPGTDTDATLGWLKGSG